MEQSYIGFEENAYSTRLSRASKQIHGREAIAACGKCVNSTRGPAVRPLGTGWSITAHLGPVRYNESQHPWGSSQEISAAFADSRKTHPRFSTERINKKDHYCICLVWREEGGEHRENMEGLGRIDVESWWGGHGGTHVVVIRSAHCALKLRCAT